MRRKFLEDLGLEVETINEIMKEHGKTVGRKDTQIDELEKDLENRDKQLKDLENNPKIDPELQKKVNEYSEENKKLKDERRDIILNAAIEVATAKEAHNPKAVLKLIDRESLEVQDDGTIKGLDEAISSLRETDSYLFTPTNSDETPPGNNDSDKQDGIKPPNNLNPGGQQGNGGKDPDPRELGKSMADKLLGKKE
ncbi:phage scaffolding protein [Macrococcoides caseolyticum]|uniref:phage scaffolding protein n=1 Tax=Macrococcoides caseolyticum TaxID=69966 RepID=UPI001C5FCBB5|nr:phage scaffolding protein [Macrococcus caseolyticus]QYA39251.1 phage scaffolding protein [Macrococcus caseolyticus]